MTIAATPDDAKSVWNEGKFNEYETEAVKENATWIS